MANLRDAMKHLLNGGMITCGNWDSDSWIRLADDGERFIDEEDREFGLSALDESEEWILLYGSDPVPTVKAPQPPRSDKFDQILAIAGQLVAHSEYSEGAAARTARILYQCVEQELED